MGDEIELSLMRRDRNSLFAVPVDAYFPDINERHPSISGQGNKSYSQVPFRFTTTTTNSTETP